MNKRNAGIIVAGSAFLLLALAGWLALFTTGTQAAAPNHGVPGAAAPARPAPSTGGGSGAASGAQQAAPPNAPNASTWVDIAPFPTVTIDFTPSPTSLKLKRAGAAAYPSNGKLYVLGGRHGTDGEDTSMRNIWEYTPGTPGTWVAKTALLDTTDPGGRQTANMAVVVLTDASGVRIYAVGGNDINSNPASLVRIYNPVADSLTTLTSDPWPASPARVPGGYTVVNNKLYIFGGFSALGNGAVYADTWRFDPMGVAGSRWTQLGSANLSMARGYIAGAALDGMIYAIGGDTWVTSTRQLVPQVRVERLDPSQPTPVWTVLNNLPVALGDMSAWAYDTGTGYEISGAIVIAGGNYPIPSAAAYQYKQASDTWGSFPSLLHATRNYGAAQLNGLLYAFGGYDYSNNTPSGANFNQRYDATGPTPTPSNTPINSPTATNTPFSTNYSVCSSTGASIDPGTTLVPGSQCGDCVNTISLPFPYTLYGQTFTTAKVAANGTLGFISAGGALVNTCLPDLGANYAIMAYWDDLDTTGAGNGIYTSVTGTAPNRVLNIEWRGTRSGGGTVNFEIRLFEGQGQFEIVYGAVVSSGSSATVGVQKDTGSLFTQYSCNTASLSATQRLLFTLTGGVCPTNTPTFTPTRTHTVTHTPTGTPPTFTPTNTATSTPCGTATNYQVSQSTGASIVPGTNDIGNHTDDGTTAVSLPFAVRLYGQVFNSANFSSNGNIQFNSADGSYQNTCMPATIFNNAILAHWDDLRTDDTGGGIFTSTTGTAPNRILNVEWRAIYYGATGSVVNFEVRLYEGQDRFDIIYGQLDQAGSGATVGVQRDTGSLFTQFECNTANSLPLGLQLIFTQPPCNTTPTNTPTPGGPTFTRTATPTITPTSTNTPTFTITPTRTNTPACQTNFTSPNVPRTICDQCTVTSTLTVSGLSTIADIDLTGLVISHTYINDLIVQLTSPLSTTVVLINRVCGSQDDFSNITLDDAAAQLIGAVCPPTANGTFRPSNPLSAFNGQNPNGTWTLTISDNAAQDVGTLSAWGLRINANSCATATPTNTPTITLTPTPTATSSLRWYVHTPVPTSNELRDVFMLNIDEGWAVGANGTVLRYSGSSWNLVNISSTDTLVDVFFLSPTNGYILGWIPGGTGGHIYHYDGSSWTIQYTSAPSNDLYRIDGVAANDVWAVGNGDFILHWNGSTWTQVPSNAGNTPNWRAVDMVSANEGWAVGQFGDINHYTSGTWGLVSSPESVVLLDLFMTTASDGWIMGLASPSFIDHYNGVSWTRAYTDNEGLYRMYMLTASDGWAVGSNAIDHFTGSAWAPVNNPTANVLNSIHMVSASEGWIVGAAGTILHYYDPTLPTRTPTRTPTNTPTNTPTPTATATCPPSTQYVSIQSFAFNPQGMTVNVGATVVWTNLDGVSHTSTSNTAIWDSGPLGTNQSFQFTFNTVGAYPYHCAIHPSMTGTITVIGGCAPTNTPTSTRTNTPTITRTPTRTNTPTNTPTSPPTYTFTVTPTPTDTPINIDAFAHFEPAGPLTVEVGQQFALDLMVNSGSNNVLASQNYLTFTSSILQNVLAGSGGCGTLTSTFTVDNSVFDSNLQNETCNGPGQCVFRGVPVDAGSIAYASGAFNNPAANGDFRIATAAFCATAIGDAVLHWQFTPPAPIDRNSDVVDEFSTSVANHTFYTDYVVHVVAPSATPVLVGHVTWQGPPAQPNALQALPISLTLRLASGGAASEYTGLTTDASGFFTVPLGSLPSGTYNWRVKGPKHLANGGSMSITAGTTNNAEMGLQRAGDCDNNNVVNAVDFAILKGTFGKSVGQPGYDDRADFNGDQVVNASDFSLLRANFGTGGAPPIGPTMRANGR